MDRIYPAGHVFSEALWGSVSAGSQVMGQARRCQPD